MKLYNSIKSLILEIASIQSIVDAIKNRQVIIIYYDGDEPGGKGIREIEPVCFGYSKANNPVVRAWDREGASHTDYKGEQPLPGWRLFRADKIMTFKPTGEVFDVMRPDYNENGDKTMIRVVINAKFEGNGLDAILGQLQTIVISELRTFIDFITKRYGIEILSKSDLGSAELYKRIYNNITTKLGRPLTINEKQKLRPEIKKIINDNQQNLKNELTNK
jgi:hypothetical protein